MFNIYLIKDRVNSNILKYYSNLTELFSIHQHIPDICLYSMCLCVCVCVVQVYPI